MPSLAQLSDESLATLAFNTNIALDNIASYNDIALSTQASLNTWRKVLASLAKGILYGSIPIDLFWAILSLFTWTLTATIAITAIGACFAVGLGLLMAILGYNKINNQEAQLKIKLEAAYVKQTALGILIERQQRALYETGKTLKQLALESCYKDALKTLLEEYPEKELSLTLLADPQKLQRLFEIFNIANVPIAITPSPSQEKFAQEEKQRDPSFAKITRKALNSISESFHLSSILLAITLIAAIFSSVYWGGTSIALSLGLLAANSPILGLPGIFVALGLAILMGGLIFYMRYSNLKWLHKQDAELSLLKDNIAEKQNAYRKDQKYLAIIRELKLLLVLQGSQPTQPMVKNFLEATTKTLGHLLAEAKPEADSISSIGNDMAKLPMNNSA